MLQTRLTKTSAGQHSAEFRERFPALVQATESGALERWRTAQPLSADNIEILETIPSITAQHSDGTEE